MWARYLERAFELLERIAKALEVLAAEVIERRALQEAGRGDSKR